MKHSDIIDYYEGLLKFIGMTSKDDVVFNVFTDTPEKINDKPLVLPTRESLRKDSHLKVYFHPLGEDVLKGESPVMETMRNMFNLRLNIAIAYLALDLVEFALNPQDLNDEQLSLISDIHVDEKSLSRVSAIIRNVNKLEIKDFYAHMYLKKNGKVNGKAYLRSSIVTFQFYEMLKVASDSNELKGLPFKMTKHDVELFLSIYRTILPLIDNKDSYNYGSNSRDFPYLESFISGMAALTDRINEIANAFEDRITDIDKIRFSTGSNINIMDFTSMVNATKVIPVLDGNDGVRHIKDEEDNKHKIDMNSSPVVDVQQMTEMSKRSVVNIPQIQTQPVQPINTESDPDEAFKRLLRSGPYSGNPQPQPGMMMGVNPNMGWSQPPMQPQPSPFMIQQQPNNGVSNMGWPPQQQVGYYQQPQFNMGQPNMGQPNMGQPNMGQPNMGMGWNQPQNMGWGGLNIPPPPNPFV